MAYRAEVDICGEGTNERVVRELRRELNPQRVHVKVLELAGPAGGNPFVRLRSNSRTRLASWLVVNGYDEIVTNEANRNAVARS